MNSNVSHLFAEISKFKGLVNKLPNMSIKKLDVKNKDGEISVTIKIKQVSEYEIFIRSEYVKNATRYRLPTIAVDEIIITNSGSFRVLGWERKNRLYPIIVKNIDTLIEYKLSLSQFHDLYDNSLKEPL